MKRKWRENEEMEREGGNEEEMERRRKGEEMERDSSSTFPHSLFFSLSYFGCLLEERLHCFSADNILMAASNIMLVSV